MALAQEDIQFIKDHLGAWLAEQSLGKPPAVYEIELRERMVRVEEELKHQRELIKTLIEQMDKRFDAMQKQLDQRSDEIGKRFDAVQKQADQRSDEIDKRFDAMQQQLDQRFDLVDKRFETLTRRIDRFMVWSYATTLTVGGLVVAALKLWP
jgi:DNA anti-recombination protein RmuC